jgi:hypothetical protein
VSAQANLGLGAFTLRRSFSTAHRLAAVLSLIVFAQILPAHADVSIFTFRERVQRSDMIITCVVENQRRVAFGLAGLFGNLHTYTKESSVRVTGCLKGSAAPGDTLRVRTDNAFKCDTSSLQKGVEYILMLRDTGKGYYVDVHAGQGEWVIGEIGKEKRVYAPTYWSYGGDPLSEFEEWVKWAMRKPETGSSDVVDGTSEALALAQQELERAGIDVEGFSLQPISRDQPDRGYGDLPELPGFCDDGDSVWCVRWVWPGYTGSVYGPSWTGIHCFVHPSTRKVRIVDHPVGRRLAPEEVLEFLFGKDQDGTPVARRITKQDFLKKASRAQRFGRPVAPPALPPRPHFFMVPGRGKSLLVLLDDTPKIVYDAEILSNE